MSMPCIIQAYKAELSERLKLTEQLRSKFAGLGDDVSNKVHQTTQVLHKAKLRAIDLTSASQQLRRLYNVSFVTVIMVLIKAFFQ